MMLYPDKCCLVWDNGLFVTLAERLARDFGHVKFYSPWKSAYPKAPGAHIGVGLAGVERVLNFWDHVGEADIVVFPDLYDADAQKICERLGKPVWGHRDAERMELDRWEMRKLQKRLGIPAPPTQRFSSIDDLSNYLKGTRNQYVKLSCFRGDLETFYHDTWHITEVILDDLVRRVGALKDHYEFIVEDAIEGVEVAYDGWTVLGQFPRHVFHGIEVKDKCYVGKFTEYDKLPAPVKTVNSLLAPVLEHEGAIGFCAFEMILKSPTEYFVIDPCLRAFSPPLEVMMEAYDNIAQIIWEGAHGNMVEPVAIGTYAVEAMLHSNFALSNWVPIEVPQGQERWLKLRNAAIIDGKLYHVPTGGEMPEIGAVVAVANTLTEAIALVKERAEGIKGHQVEIHTHALDDAQQEIFKGHDVGIEF